MAAGVEDIVKVKIADFRVAAAPCKLVTNGLGSCVGLSLYDMEAMVGGLAHIMLPTSGREVDPKFYPRYADTAISIMLAELEEKGCSIENMVAKIAGGASMFPGLKKENKGVGDRNVEAVTEILGRMKIEIVGSDTGGDYGRSIDFSTVDGTMQVRSIMHGVITI